MHLHKGRHGLRDPLARHLHERLAGGHGPVQAKQPQTEKAAARAIIADLPVVPRTVVRTKQRNRALYWTLVILGSPLSCLFMMQLLQFGGLSSAMGQAGQLGRSPRQ